MNNVMMQRKRMKARIDASMPNGGADGQLTLKPTESIKPEDSGRRRVILSSSKINSATNLSGLATQRSEGGFMNVFPKFETQANLSQYFFGKSRLKTENLDASIRRDKESDVANQNKSTVLSVGVESSAGALKTPRIPTCFLKKFSCKEKAQESTFWLRTGKMLPKNVIIPSSMTVKKANNAHLNISLKHLPTDPGFQITPTSQRGNPISFYM